MNKQRQEVRRLMMAIDRIDEVYYGAQKISGMKDSLFVLMYALSNGVPQTQKQICEEWRIPRSTLNTTVLEQVREGNLELTSDGHKHKQIHLTDKGKNFIEAELAPLFSAEEDAAVSMDIERLTDKLALFATYLEENFRKQISEEEAASSNAGSTVL